MTIINLKADILARFVWSLKDFHVNAALAKTDDHVGAIIVDAILQSGMNYQKIVRPRVEKLKATYPDARTTDDFLDLIERVGLSELIGWNGKAKLETIRSIAGLFQREGIQTRADLRGWLLQFGNADRMKQIKGVGNMTADYIKMLAGVEVCAADGLTIGFMKQAGLEHSSYEESRDVLTKSARIMDVSPIALCFSIWDYVHSKRQSASSASQ